MEENIHRLQLDELFPDEYVYDYKINRNILLDELLRANVTLFILDRIQNSPIAIFFPFGSIFWSAVTDSLFETCIMCMWRVSVDGTFPNGLTLRKFKNQIVQHFKEEKDKKAFIDELRIQKFETKVQQVESQIQDIRNNFIAHLNKHRYPLYTYKNIKWDISNTPVLMKYQEELNNFFETLQFGEMFALQYAEYDESTYSHWNNYRPDIEEYIDSIIKNSRILNAFEKEPEYWDYVQKKLLSREQIQTVMDYRKKFGLNISPK